jgi:hypothetical protein
VLLDVRGIGSIPFRNMVNLAGCAVGVMQHVSMQLAVAPPNRAKTARAVPE